MPENLLELNRATVVRSSRRVLDSVSMKIPIGRHTAILGPNGSGKSTLIKLITRELYPLHNGALAPIRILGKDRWNVAELRGQLGIISPDLERALETEGGGTGLQTVLSGVFSSYSLYSHTRVTSDMEAKAEHLLALVGAAHLSSRPITEMSSGEIRRILIARALVTSPRSLILDEPTAGLDLVARRSFLERLRAIANAGTTIVMITHHVEEIIPEIEWMILMKDGSLVVEGPTKETLTSSNVSAVFSRKLNISLDDGYFCANLDF